MVKWDLWTTRGRGKCFSFYCDRPYFKFLNYFKDNDQWSIVPRVLGVEDHRLISRFTRFKVHSNSDPGDPNELGISFTVRDINTVVLVEDFVLSRVYQSETTGRVITGDSCDLFLPGRTLVLDPRLCNRLSPWLRWHQGTRGQTGRFTQNTRPDHLSHKTHLKFLMSTIILIYQKENNI